MSRNRTTYIIIEQLCELLSISKINNSMEMGKLGAMYFRKCLTFKFDASLTKGKGYKIHVTESLSLV